MPFGLPRSRSYDAAPSSVGYSAAPATRCSARLCRRRADATATSRFASASCCSSPFNVGSLNSVHHSVLKPASTASLGACAAWVRSKTCGGAEVVGASKFGPTVQPAITRHANISNTNVLKEKSLAFILHLPLLPACRHADRRRLPFPQTAPRSTQTPPPDLDQW